MKKLILVTVLSLSALFLTTRAHAGVRPTGDTSYIYVYRVGQFSGAGANWAVFLDGEKKCKLSNNKFMRLAVTPGKHTISARVGGMSIMKKETEIEVEATAGGSNYVACSVKQSITRQRLEMVEVVKNTASKQMEKMSLDNCQEAIEE